MKISNRVKRNISFSLLIIGIMCTCARAWEVIMAPDSGKAWFQLFGIVVLTYLCFDSFRDRQKKVRDGNLFG